MPVYWSVQIVPVYWSVQIVPVYWSVQMVPVVWAVQSGVSVIVGQQANLLSVQTGVFVSYYCITVLVYWFVQTGVPLVH